MADKQFIYVYDGSFQGLLTCVFTAFENKEYPIEIRTDDNTLLPCKYVESEDGKAKRVKVWIKKTFGEYDDVIALTYLSRENNIEVEILKLTRLVNAKGNLVLKDLCDPFIGKMLKLAQSVKREAHRIIEFSRFSDYNGNLVAKINPKYFILPLIKNHFIQRFPNEKFLIYDEVFEAALIYENKKSAIISIDNFEMPEPTAEELKFRELWKLFYDTIEIKERRNHKLRMQHLPKRFWVNVTELSEELKK